MHPKQFPFNGYEQGPDFDRARSQIATPFQYVDIALDVAASNQVYNVSGDFLYVDASSSGVATLELNNQYNDPSAPFYIQAGFGLNALFKQVKLSWAAQAGKRIRLMYSTGDRVVPTNSTTINGTVTTVNNGFSYGASYKSSTLMAGSTPDLVFNAASNPNGAVIWRGSFISRQGNTASGAAFIAKATAPGTVIDGDVILATDSIGVDGVNYNYNGRLETPIRVPAGKGVYYITGFAENGSYRNLLYTLL